jgi:hypothetical protein
MTSTRMTMDSRTSLRLPLRGGPLRGHLPLRGCLPLVLSCLGVVTGACEGSPQTIDAATPVSSRMAAVSVRIDVAQGQPASLTVLAFRAAFSGVAPADVLGLVDPLAAGSPQRDCTLRDVDRAAAELVARGDAIELEELTGVGVAPAAGTGDTTLGAAIRPSPRLYPEVAAAIGGVVAEAGPVGMHALPDRLRIAAGDAATAAAAIQPPGDVGSGDAVMVTVPAPAWLTLLNGAAPRTGAGVETGADLSLVVATGGAAAAGGTGAAGAASSPVTFELRPLGATVALVCPVPTMAPADRQVAFVIPRLLVAALVSASGAAPATPVAAALDVVRRGGERLPVSEARVAVEVRTSTLVELRP